MSETTEDPVKFEQWKPEIERVRKIRDDSIVKEYLVPEDKLPAPDRMNVTNVPYEAGTMSEKELKITETTAVNLVAQMAAGELSAEEVLIAFMKRATIAQQLLNCVTEFLTEEAFAKAKELDAYYKKTGKTTVGPLHGIPLSIKEHLSVKGKEVNAGFVGFIGRVVDEDNLQLSILKKAGVVPFARTNEPQSLMHADSSNNIYGMTLNPYNRLLSAGGSSGGEGALVGFHGSPFGIGSDIGGSIRIPAAFNGCYGYRPTAQRITVKGRTGAGAGQITILPSIGPLTQSAEDLDLYMKTVTDGEPWEVDCLIPIMPWRKVDTPKSLTIGVMKDDGLVYPVKPMIRALDYAIEKLEKAGHKIVPFEAIKPREVYDVALNSFYADNGSAQKAALGLSGEPWLELTKYALSYAKPLSTLEQWQQNAIRNAARVEWDAKMKELGIDIILCPAYFGPAALSHDTEHWAYTALFNSLDMPGSVFPTGITVDPKIDAEDSFKARTEYEAKQRAKYLNAPEKYAGAPIDLQLIGRHYRDEEVLAYTKVISAAILDK
ncbi:hypothetical protein CANCADRAFT_21597 [Tortispora caseinolytica NRRL Y-17796]|uniref:amidase n=1 Tax=Tortispora caseinolytica NRRL Y-17796 TaxID=767744 RepID=A0A1E4TJ75_9ASCO|nr:hypothetical protein CANCADRAFT_21597 [Tortispora caseinolytica NRRL Y-17796]